MALGKHAMASSWLLVNLLEPEWMTYRQRGALMRLVSQVAAEIDVREEHGGPLPAEWARVAALLTEASHVDAQLPVTSHQTSTGRRGATEIGE